MAVGRTKTGWFQRGLAFLDAVNTVRRRIGAAKWLIYIAIIAVLVVFGYKYGDLIPSSLRNFLPGNPATTSLPFSPGFVACQARPPSNPKIGTTALTSVLVFTEPKQTTYLLLANNIQEAIVKAGVNPSGVEHDTPSPAAHFSKNTTDIKYFDPANRDNACRLSSIAQRLGIPNPNPVLDTDAATPSVRNRIEIYFPISDVR